MGGWAFFLRNVFLPRHLISPQMATSLSYYLFASNGIVEYARYPLLETLTIVMILIAGIIPFSWIYRISASLLFCIPIGLIVLSIYVFVTKNIVRDKIDLKWHC